VKSATVERVTEADGDKTLKAAPDAVTDAVPAANKPQDHGILYYMGLGLSAALLLVVIALALVLVVVPKVGGATPLTVLTQSMEPLYPPGTLIFVRPVKPADIKVGDVITYQIQSGQPAVISHRVIAINSPADGKRSFILKGDNNSSADPAAVIPAQIKGRLWYSVPLLGWVSNTVNGKNRSWIVDVLAGGLFAYAAYMVIAGIASASRSRKKKAVL
jgi:signal peptidase